MTVAARLLLVGASAALRAALAEYCPPEDIASVADATAALVDLRARGAESPRLIVIDGAALDAVAATAALKADALAATTPLVVICNAGEAGAIEACYRAGANACVIKPAAAAALREMAGALVGFWLGANAPPPPA